MIRLFSAYIILDEHRGFHQVKVHLFNSERKKPLASPYEELITDYVPGGMAELAINEYFTEEEIEFVKRYFEEGGKKVFIEEVDLPIPRQTLGFGLVGADRTSDYFGYKGGDLPFKMAGWFNLEDTQLAEEHKKRIEEIPIDTLRFIVMNDFVLRERLIEILKKGDE